MVWILLLVMVFSGAAAVGQTSAGQAPAAADATPTVAADEMEKPLPDVKQLLLDVEKNQDAAERSRRDYTYHVHQEDTDLDGKGQVKKTKTTDAESLTIDGVRVNRVVARDGKPLTPDELKKEAAEIDKEVAKAKERRAKLDEKGKPSDSRGDEELTASRIMELGQLSNEHRIDLNGRPTIVADYTGDPNVKTRNRFESMFRDLVGTVWIDEKDRALVQAQGHFLNDFKIGGGLVADVKKNSGFSARWTKINDEVWLPAEFHGDGTIRVLLFGGFSGRVTFVTSDYRKFRSSATILGSNGPIDADGKPIAAPEGSVTAPK